MNQIVNLIQININVNQSQQLSEDLGVLVDRIDDNLAIMKTHFDKIEKNSKRMQELQTEYNRTCGLKYTIENGQAKLIGFESVI